MNVSLTPQLEAMVRGKVETGMYNNASEVVREALRMLEAHDRTQRLRQSLIEADAEIDRGEGEEWTPARREQLWREGDELYRQGVKSDPNVSS